MKKLLLTFILSTVILTTLGQDTSRLKGFGVGLSYSYGRYEIESAIDPCVILHIGQSKVFMGPLFVPVTSNLKADKKVLTGFQLGYKIYPNRTTKVFNFFFCFDLNYLKTQNDYTVSDAPASTWPPVLTKINDKVFDFGNFIGYGCDISLIKNLSISTNFGIGVDLHKNFIFETYSNGMTHGHGDFDNELDFCGILKIGLEYDFKRKK